MPSFRTRLAYEKARLDAAKLVDAIEGSYTAPSIILTGSDAGSDATVTIANHTRFWNDATNLAVTGDSVTGLAYSTLYAVYYDDPDRDAAAPTYSATTDLKTAQSNYVMGRVFCGNITTPASGGGATTGGGGGSGGDYSNPIP